MEACERGRMQIPDVILNKPILREYLHIYMEAYLDLDSERSHTEGPTAIPITSMMQYLDFFGYPDAIAGDFIYLIKAMDSANCKRISKEIEAKYKKK